LVSLIVGVLSFLGLTLLRVDFALLIGIVAGIFDVIPYFGPVIGALPAIIIALLESPSSLICSSPVCGDSPVGKHNYFARF